MTTGVRPEDDRPHAPGAGAGWREVFDLGWFAPDGRSGGHVTVVIWPTVGLCWYWGAAVSESWQLVTVVATDLDLPPNGLELRGPGIWASHTCESPLTHWSYGLECFAVRIDDPAESWRGPDPAPGEHTEVRGERVAFGLDIEWEAASEPEPLSSGFSQSGRVHGEVLVGHDRLSVDGPGVRDRLWSVDCGTAGSLRAASPTDHRQSVGPVSRPQRSPNGLLSTVRWTEPAGPTWRVVRGLSAAEGRVGWSTEAAMVQPG